MDNNKAQLKDYYNKNVVERDAKIKSDWKIDLRNDFLSIIKDRGLKSILEIGAGTGQDSLFFMENGLDVTAVDLSQEHVKRCWDKGIDAHVMDFSDMTFADNSFDVIYAMNCLLHIPNAEMPSVIYELKRVLKLNGMIILCQYGDKQKSNEGFKDYGGRGERFFSFRTVEKFSEFIKDAGLIIEKSGTIELCEDNYNSQYFVVKKI